MISSLGKGDAQQTVKLTVPMNLPMRAGRAVGARISRQAQYCGAVMSWLTCCDGKSWRFFSERCADGA